jgi:LmbE family N-acetylglucosaminyl deacetylase
LTGYIYGGRVGFTLVSFHAHPDDEAIYTGGTLARAAAEGHRVVLAVATDGSAGLADSRHGQGTGLSNHRMRELEASAAILGCARVVPLGFRDSGWRTQPPAGAFSTLPLDGAAKSLAALLREERADALTIYDPAGGYGHPDHRQVHAVGSAAAALMGTPLVLEATVDRNLIRPVAGLIAAIPGLLPEVRSADYVHAYTAHAAITHRVNVRAYADQKRRALLAHYSQATSDKGIRTAALLLKLPTWMFGRVLGREWFVEQGRVPGKPLDDIFQSLRHGSS